MNAALRESISRELEIRHTDRPFVHEVVYQGETIGIVAQSPYWGLHWEAKGIKRGFYSKQDAALALVEGRSV